MGLKEDIEEGLRRRQQNLIERVGKFITRENMPDSQVAILYDLLIDIYKIGGEALGSGAGTDYKPQEFFEELKIKINDYLPRTKKIK